MGITFANQKCGRNVKRTIKTSEMALLLIESIESFTTSVVNVLIDYEFP